VAPIEYPPDRLIGNDREQEKIPARECNENYTREERNVNTRACQHS
jgi:hypothetical protein